MPIAEGSPLDLFGLPGELVGIILGWALGALSPLLLWYMVRARERSELIDAIKGELTELRVTFAMDAHTLKERTGRLDDTFLHWLIKALEESPGVDPQVRTYAQALHLLLSQPEGARASQPATQILMKPHRLVLVDANLSRLGICPLPFQQRIVNVARLVANWNEDARFLETQFERTFDTSLGPINRQIVQANIDRAYAKALRSSTELVDELGQVLHSTT